MEDCAILKLLRQQDPAGLEALVAKYKNLACAVALQVLGRDSVEDALECVNDAFYDIWRSIAAYDQEITSLKGWVALVTRRRTIDRLRKAGRLPTLPLKDFAQSPGQPDHDPEEALARQEEVKRLNAFVKALPELDRHIFVRRFFLLEDINSLAGRYGVSRAAVDNRLSRMRKSLREYLREGVAQT